VPADTRELLCDAMQGGTEYGSDLADLDRYFFHFAVATIVGQCEAYDGNAQGKIRPQTSANTLRWTRPS